LAIASGYSSRAARTDISGINFALLESDEVCGVEPKTATNRCDPRRVNAITRWFADLRQAREGLIPAQLPIRFGDDP
jgi:hypothetical protein